MPFKERFEVKVENKRFPSLSDRSFASLHDEMLRKHIMRMRANARFAAKSIARYIAGSGITTSDVYFYSDKFVEGRLLKYGVDAAMFKYAKKVLREKLEARA